MSATSDKSGAETPGANLDGVRLEFEGGLMPADEAGIDVCQPRAVGGGSRSDARLQLRAGMFKLLPAQPRASRATTFGGGRHGLRGL